MVETRAASSTLIHGPFQSQAGMLELSLLPRTRPTHIVFTARYFGSPAWPTEGLANMRGTWSAGPPTWSGTSPGPGACTPLLHQALQPPGRPAACD
jgi:hypothetical protein